MSAVRSILSNTLARSITELINRLGGALFWIMVARYYGATGLGTLAYALAMFSLFSTMSTLGLGSVAVREIARDRSKAAAYFGQGLVLGLVLSLVFAVLMIIAGSFLHPAEKSHFAVIAMSIAIFPASGFYWSKNLLMAAEKMHYIALARSWENGFKVIVGLLMVMAGAGLREMVLVLVFSKIISFVICFKYASDKVTMPDWRPQASVIPYLIRQAPWFSLITICNSLFWALPVILITSLHGEAQAGIFSAAFKLVEMIIALALAYGGAFFPVISRVAAEKGRRFAELTGKSVKYITVLTLAIAGLTQFIAPQIISFLYGPGMHAAVPVLKTLVWLIVPYGVIPVMAFSLISRNLQKYDLAANAVGVLVLLAGAYFLVPANGAWGMAVSLVIAGVMFLMVELLGMMHHILRAMDMIEWLKPVPGTLLMFAIYLIFQDSAVWMSMFAGAVLYVAYIWLSKTITQPEILYLKNSIFVR